MKTEAFIKKSVRFDFLDSFLDELGFHKKSVRFDFLDSFLDEQNNLHSQCL